MGIVLDNHVAAIALYVPHYNLCRVHQTLRVTPAMALGLTDHPWSIGELIEAAEATGHEPGAPDPVPPPIPNRPNFAVIQGGRTN